MRVYGVPNDVPHTISEPIFSPEFRIRFHAWLNFFSGHVPKWQKLAIRPPAQFTHCEWCCLSQDMPNYIMDMNVLLCAEKLHIYAVSGLYPDAFLTQKVGEIALWTEWLVLQMTKSLDVPG